MDWSNLRGTALEKPVKDALDLTLLEYRIMYIVRQELNEFVDYIKINNISCGKWNYI